MPYRKGRMTAYLEPDPVDQVGNALDSQVNLTAPPENLVGLRARWAALLTGQPIPRIGERVPADTHYDE